MNQYYFDPLDRFVIENYDAAAPFASFLPGIAGPLGIPMWAFYVNRGQAIASFGIESKDVPIMEFQPANKAYQTTPYTGFRTFIKLQSAAGTRYYEPFSAVAPAPPPGPLLSAAAGDRLRMSIGPNELELEESSALHGLQTNVLYFTLPGEGFAGLVRQVTVKNCGELPITLEVLDGLPLIIPYGLNNALLKDMSRTAEAWMAVFNLEAGLPFYRVQASVGDEAEVETVQAGHFYLAFAVGDDHAETPRLTMFVDPNVVFGANTALSYPDRFLAQPLAELQAMRQITVCRTPCGLAGAAATLAPGAALTLYAIIGHVSDVTMIEQQRARLSQPATITAKRAEARALAQALTDPIATQTGNPRFDAYCQQSQLDNILRGGWPVRMGGQVYHLYGRRHGDLERDYNLFSLPAEFYSQGNASYRDVNQNRRSDVLLNPAVSDSEVLAFLGLIQADGYNPLTVLGSRFVIPPERQAAILALTDRPEALRPLLARPFTPGQLLKTLIAGRIGLAMTPEAFVETTIAQADWDFDAEFGEGYWVDHWFYNLDLLDAYLAVYPDHKEELLFAKTVPYTQSPAFVQPRNHKSVLVAEGKVRQYGAVVADEEVAQLMAARTTAHNLMRTAHGHGEIFRTTVFSKLVGLALLKFATLDPQGMGIEMEAGKPGWCDALNGLPGLFGSSLSETYELQRLLDFLLAEVVMAHVPGTREMPGTSDPLPAAVTLPGELADLLRQVSTQLAAYHAALDPQRDERYWDAVASAREAYRARVRLGFDGRTETIDFATLTPILQALRDKVLAGILAAEALTDGVPPTYFTYEVSDYALLTAAAGQPQCDEHGRRYVRVKGFVQRVLPPFLEGPMHALRFHADLRPGSEAVRQPPSGSTVSSPAAIIPDKAAHPQAKTNVQRARALYDRVKASPLFDAKLGMYKTNAPLATCSPEIGRLRAFTPGWLENESVFLHMAYKYLLATLRAGLRDEFFADMRRGLVPFLDPQTYGRSPLENSSFLVSSAHPDASLHGRGYVARLTGATAEFLSMWVLMMVGPQPFFLQDGELHLAFKPTLPDWLFREDGALTFTFLGQCAVTYRKDRPITDMAQVTLVNLHLADGDQLTLPGGVIPAPYAAMVRNGEIRRIEMRLE